MTTTTVAAAVISILFFTFQSYSRLGRVLKREALVTVVAFLQLQHDYNAVSYSPNTVKHLR